MILKNQKEDFKDNTKKSQCSRRCHANIPDIGDILYYKKVQWLHFDEALLANLKLLRY